MSELFKMSLVRPAYGQSIVEARKKAFFTHSKEYQSERYLGWLRQAKAENFLELESSMRSFLESGEALRSLDQIPEILRKPIEFAQEHGYAFSVAEFARTIISEPKAKELEPIRRKTLLLLQDQLLAETQVVDAQPGKVDLQKAILTLELVRMVGEYGPEKLKMPVKALYEKPVVIDFPTTLLEHCARLRNIEPSSTGDPNSNGETRDDPKKDCLCHEKEGKDPCDCKCDENCYEQDPCCARIIPYVAELYVVKDELKCYVPAEISYIENVIHGETRERTHRRLSREETYFEREEEKNTVEQRDHEFEERFALKREVETVLQTELGMQTGATFTYGGDTAPMKFTAHTNFSFDLDRKNTRKMVQDESKTVISKALSRVETKVRTLTSRRVINEIEETNHHVLKGLTGDMSRQFLNVNQLCKAQVFSYGSRMMLDLYLPGPSELFKRMLEKEFGGEKPEKPCINIEDIQPRDYDKYVQCYGFTDLEPPVMPLPPKTMTLEIKREKPKKGGSNWGETYPITIPAGYYVSEMKLDNSVINASGIVLNKSNHYVSFNFGGRTLVDTMDNTSPPDDFGPKTGMNVSGAGNATISTKWLKRFDIRIQLKLTPLPVDNSGWQREVWRRIYEKYELELAAYEKALSEHEDDKRRKYNQNPGILSELMKEQLKHAAISYISCQFFDNNNALVNRVEPCGYPQMDLRETKREGQFMRFFEQAFEWNFMSYMLYPYYWDRKYTWEDKLGEQSENNLFTKFLQSGGARITIPVRLLFEGFVNFFLQTRRIWGPTGTPPSFSDPAFLAIEQEIRESMNNFNADRDGEVICDTSLGLAANQIVLRNSSEYLDFTNPAFPVYDQALADLDHDREIFVNCKRYRIMSIHKDISTGEIILTLDRDFDETKDFPWDWSTGALFIGAAWEFLKPTSLIWLREESRCLPCYPIACTENAVVL